MKAPIIAVVIVIVLGVGVAMYYSYSGGNPLNYGNTQQTTTKINTPLTMTGLEIAGQIMSFVNSQKTSDGFYSYSFNCGSVKSLSVRNCC